MGVCVMIMPRHSEEPPARGSSFKISLSEVSHGRTRSSEGRLPSEVTEGREKPQRSALTTKASASPLDLFPSTSAQTRHFRLLATNKR